VLFVVACFLGNPPGQAGGTDGSKRKGYLGGRLDWKIGDSEKENKGEKKGNRVRFIESPLARHSRMLLAGIQELDPR